MKRMWIVALAAGLGVTAGCSDPKTREENRKKEEAAAAREEITEMLELVIAGVREVNARPYYEHLCEEQRNQRSLEEVQSDWNDQKQLLQERMGGAKLVQVGVDTENSNLASAVIDAPNHPLRKLLFDLVKENGSWKIREAFKQVN